MKKQFVHLIMMLFFIVCIISSCSKDDGETTEQQIPTSSKTSVSINDFYLYEIDCFWSKIFPQDTIVVEGKGYLLINTDEDYKNLMDCTSLDPYPYIPPVNFSTHSLLFLYRKMSFASHIYKTLTKENDKKYVLNMQIVPSTAQGISMFRFVFLTEKIPQDAYIVIEETRLDRSTPPNK